MTIATPSSGNQPGVCELAILTIREIVSVYVPHITRASRPSQTTELFVPGDLGRCGLTNIKPNSWQQPRRVCCALTAEPPCNPDNSASF